MRIKNKLATCTLPITYREFLKLSKNAPRVTSMLDAFESIAAGKTLAPSPIPGYDLSLLHGDKDIISCCDYLVNNMGVFAAHYYASIPYSLEQDARVIAALSHYFKDKSKNIGEEFCFYEPSGETGSTSRLIAAITKGLVKSICCSPNKANKQEFYRLKETDSSAHFYLGAITDITHEYLSSGNIAPHFKAGFDIVYERCTLQMYGPDRFSQLYHLKRIVKKDGILILQGKYLNEDNEYIKREMIKDKYFKARFFKQSAIIKKEEVILKTMTYGQVTMDTMVEAIKHHFKYATIIWNSTNFYTLVISDSLQNIRSLLNKMSPPCIPENFNFEGILPKSLVGMS